MKNEKIDAKAESEVCAVGRTTNGTKGCISNQFTAFPVRDVRDVRGYLPPLLLKKNPSPFSGRRVFEYLGA